MGPILTGVWRKDEEIEASLSRPIAVRPISVEDLQNLDVSQVVDMFNRVLGTLTELDEEIHSNHSAIEALSREIRTLKRHTGQSPLDVTKLRQDSKKRAAELRARLALGNPPSDGFAKMRGLIKKYSDENEDSVEFLRRARENEC